ncbi:MAG: AMP-binding protein, partial [Thermomicrobiales bacterium]
MQPLRSLTSQSTVPTLIRARAQEIPDRIALLDDRRTMTYAELGARVASLARELRERGRKADDRALLFLDANAGIDGTILCLAAMCAGTAIVLDASAPPAWRERMVARIKPGVIISRHDLGHDAAAPLALQYADGPILPGREEYKRDVRSEIADPSPETVALVLATSGTTAEPRL